MKLFYSKGACSLAVRIAIYEIGVSCTFESVNLKTKQTETGTNFLSINPKGSVPALLLDDKNILTENTAIQQYLAETYKATELLPAVGDFNRFRVLEWLSYISSELHKSFGPFFNAQTSPEAKENASKNLKAKLQFINGQLKSPYLTGKTFTSADCYLVVALSWLSHVGIPLSDYENLNRYFSDVVNRKSVAKAFEDEGVRLLVPA